MWTFENGKDSVLMKKRITLLLVVAMLLCGCSAASGNPEDSKGSNEGGQGIGGFFANIAQNIGEALKKEEKALLELGTGEKDESLMVLKITVNPEFELYLDMDSCVSRVRCLNEDAVTAFQTMTDNGINVIGQFYADAMTTILENLSSTGFLTAQTEKIQIETTVHIELTEEDMEGLTAALAEPVLEYSAENDLAMTVKALLPIVDTKVEVELPESDVNKGEPNSERTYEFENNGISGTVTEYYDENGIQYKRVMELADGWIDTTHYAANGAVTYTHNIQANGQITEWYFDEDGNGTKNVITYADGTHDEITYHSEGVKASRIISSSDGSYSEEYFTESGAPISSISIGADGSKIESTWYENGNLKSRITDDSYGHLENHYFEDGTMSKTIDSSSQGYHETVYYPNGQVEATIGDNGERRYDESGKLIYDRYESDTQSYLFEDGELVYYIQNGEEITDPEHLAAFAAALGFG